MKTEKIFYAMVRDLLKVLQNTEADEVQIRTSRATLGWDDVQFYAHKAGFSVSRDLSAELLARNEFPEIYVFTRS